LSIRALTRSRSRWATPASSTTARCTATDGSARGRLSIAALVIVSALLWRSRHAMTASSIGLSLILGGALGNLWDRMLSGRVVDFLLVYIGSYQWPAFNVADSAIVVGAALLVFEILFTKAPEAEKTAS